VRYLLSILFACATVALNGALASTIVVTTTADTGPGSLRAALFQASSNAGPDDIVFQIPGPGEAGVHYIRPATPLPRLDGAQSGSIYHGDSTRLLGESQRAFGGDTNPAGPEIVLDGANAGENSTGLVFWAANCLIREITIQKFDRFGIEIMGTNNKVEGCYIGTDANGALANAGNGQGGIVVQGSGNIIGGPTEAARNIISGNGFGTTDPGGNGIHVPAPGGVTIEGNYIGVDRTGAQPAANWVRGVLIEGPNVVVRRNVISGHAGAGVYVITTGSYSIIEGNLIGTNAAGTAALPNGTGVSVQGIESMIGPEGVTIGGLTGAARNVLSGNRSHGLSIGGRAHGCVIQGNYIGTDISGMTALPNGELSIFRGGVQIERGSNHLVGGTLPGAGNVISGNKGDGLSLFAYDCTVQGNFIGVAADGQTPLGNNVPHGSEGAGVVVSAWLGPVTTGRNRIGGPEPGAGNVIAYNSGSGVVVLRTENSVLGNSIFNNGAANEGAIGIDLDGFGLTPNDVGDTDGEDGTFPFPLANDYQNHPVLTSLSFQEGNVTVVGKLDSTPNTIFRLEFFATDPLISARVSEGQTFLGATQVTTNGSGLASFNLTLPVPSAEQIITATATDPTGNTSEFGGLPDRLLNISTRGRIWAGGDTLIAGFIITGQNDKQVVIRGIGPSLTGVLPGALQNPWLELYQGDALLQSNDDWRASQQAEIEVTGLAPAHDAESAIVRTLAPGVYTAVLRGQNNTSGIALIEAYDTRRAVNSQQANISTRGFVGLGDDVMIAGFIVSGQSGRGTRIAARALGPSLSNFGVTGVLLDPVIELTDANGEVVRSNNNWTELQQTEIESLGLAPTDNRESALVATLPAGNYTAIVRGNDNTVGVGLVEVYNVPP
jgi:hypothetical protein